MAITIQIDGIGDVDVGDSFKNMSAPERDAYVDHIRQQVGKGVRSGIFSKAAPPAPQMGGIMQTADDAMRLAASNLTGGYADKASAGLNALFGVDQNPRGLSDLVTGNNQGSLYERNLAAERAQTEAARQRLGLAGTAVELGAAILPSSRIAKGVALAGDALKAAPAIISRVAANPFAQAAVSGAITGAGTAAGNDQDIGRGAAEGAVFGPVAEGAGRLIAGGVNKVAGAFNRPDVPNLQDLKKTAQDAYKRMENAGARYTPEGTRELSTRIEDALRSTNYEPELAPQVPALQRIMGRYHDQYATPENLQSIRQVAADITKSANAAERRIGGRLLAEIDDFIGSATPQQIVGANGADVAADLAMGNEYWKRFSKVGAIERAIEKAGRRTASTGSGGNIDNATRQELDKALGRVKNWTPDERQALDDAINGSTAQNAARLMGKLSPVGHGLMFALDAGGLAANKMLGLPIAAGAASKFIADRATLANARNVAELAAMGGRQSAMQMPPNAVQRFAQKSRPGVVQGLLNAGLLGTRSRPSMGLLGQ